LLVDLESLLEVSIGERHLDREEVHVVKFGELEFDIFLSFVLPLDTEIGV